MIEMYSQGDPKFMGILTVILICLLVLCGFTIVKKSDKQQVEKTIQLLKYLGALGLVLGILGQLIGLYNALSVMESVQGVSPAIVYGGLKVSIITTLYGLVIFIAYLICAMILRQVRS